jgi:hypothetical protein
MCNGRISLADISGWRFIFVPRRAIREAKFQVMNALWIMSDPGPAHKQQLARVPADKIPEPEKPATPLSGY